MRECKAHEARISKYATVFAVVLVLALSIVAKAQDQQAASLLGVGDWVSIQIAGQPDTTSYVGGDGTITVPLIGNIPVAGIPPARAADRIAKALKDGGYFVDPRVTVLATVSATQSPGQFISVVGEVGAQGRYPITPRTTILDVLAQAGGVRETASDVGYVLRSDGSGHMSRYPINLNLLTENNDASPPWTFLAGDSLVVPRAEQFSIQGEVASPGKYRIEPGMTIMQAIAQAGGVTERGSERRIQLKRETKPGQYQTIRVKPTDLVKAGDIIRVKESLF